jgi:hypothetical protein
VCSQTDEQLVETVGGATPSRPYTETEEMVSKDTDSSRTQPFRQVRVATPRRQATVSFGVDGEDVCSPRW